MGEKVCGIIVAAGAGTRLGRDTPKAFVDLAGRPLVAHSLGIFDRHRDISSIVLVVHESMAARARELTRPLDTRVEIVRGGEHRWQSVEQGVTAAGGECEWCLVHDAARPFVCAATIDALLAKRGEFSCAITATPMVDTVRRFEGDRCVATLDRTMLLRVGTPQLFHRAKLLEAFEKAHGMKTPPTDEAILMELCGYAVGVAWADALNFKITTPADLALARAWVDWSDTRGIED